MVIGKSGGQLYKMSFHEFIFSMKQPFDSIYISNVVLFVIASRRTTNFCMTYFTGIAEAFGLKAYMIFMLSKPYYGSIILFLDFRFPSMNKLYSIAEIKFGDSRL